MNDFSVAEYFLLTWAILSTVFAGYCWGRAKYYYVSNMQTSILLAELASGDIVAKTRADGFTVVENENVKMSFKKRGKDD